MVMQPSPCQPFDSFVLLTLPFVPSLHCRERLEGSHGPVGPSIPGRIQPLAGAEWTHPPHVRATGLTALSDSFADRALISCH